MKTSKWKLLLTLLTLLFGVGFSRGQTQPQAILSGTVYDPAGAVVANAHVTATDSKGVKFDSVSNDRGEYRLVMPGCRYSMYPSTPVECRLRKYDVRVEAPGFDVSMVTGYRIINVNHGARYSRSLTLDFALEPTEIKPTMSP